MTATTTAPNPPGPPAGPPPTSRLVRAVRGVGWTLITTGVLILLYLVYLLFFTSLQTDAAQQSLLDQWELEFGAVEDALPGENEDGQQDPVSPGDAYAAMWFERDGERIVHQETLFVVEGVEVADLRRGPGHYPESQAPGEVGNFAVSGHRTTYGEPFSELQELREGDTIHVVDRDQRTWVYEFHEQRIVAPTAIEVVGPDPLGEGGAWMTLTTCHPRWSAAQRMIVFASLVQDPIDDDDPEPTEQPTAGELPDEEVEDGPVGATSDDVPLPPPIAWIAFALGAAAIAGVVAWRRHRAGKSTTWVSVAVGSGLFVLLAVLFTTVFPWLERTISDPTLGA